MQESSLIGVFKLGLMIIGGLVVFRFIGQLMNAKRNLAEDEAFRKSKLEEERIRKKAEQNHGKITIINTSDLEKTADKNSGKIEDISHEEL